jgi:hypothetical protein
VGDNKFVYIAGEDTIDPPYALKIGKADNPYARRVGLQNGNPRPIVVHAVLPGGHQEEQRLHLLCQFHRILGEWFEPEAADILIREYPELAEPLRRYTEGKCIRTREGVEKENARPDN